MQIQEVLDRFDIRYLTEGHHHCSEGWVQLDCPFCSPNSEKWRLGYNISFGYINCWSCGRLRLTDVLMELTGLPYRTIKEAVDGVEQRHTEKRKCSGVLKLPGGLEEGLLPAHRSYLAGRGFDPDELVRLWGLAGIGRLGQHLRWRVLIPIHRFGDVVSWTARTIHDEREPRYWSATLDQEAHHHKDAIYGADYARNSILVHEGPVDVWASGPGAGATLGTGFTQAQVNILSRFPRRAICFDNSQEAQQRARELCRALCVFPGTTENVQIDFKDPGECLLTEAGRRELRQLRKHFLE